MAINSAAYPRVASKGQEVEIQHTQPFEAKISILENEDKYPAGAVEGYASVFDNVDLGGDIVERGAFAKTLRENLKRGRIKFVDSHNIRDGSKAIIGVVTEAKEDEHGLWFRARLSSTALAQDVRTKIKEQILSALSFGYQVVKDQVDETRKARILKELKLYEISIVPWGMNPLAELTAAKGVVSLGSYGLAPEDTPWRAAQATARFQAWVSDAEPTEWSAADWARYRRGFLWFDSADAEKLGSYYMPVVDVVDGEPKYVFRAAVTVLAALRGARGAGTGPWADDKEGIERQVAGLYKRFGKTMPEKGIPNEDTGEVVEEQSEELKAMVSDLQGITEQMSLATLLAGFHGVLRSRGL